MSKLCAFFAPGFEECEGLLVVDILRRGGVDVTIAAVGADRMVTGSHKIAVQADALAQELDFSAFDAVFLPGGMPGTLHLKENALVRRTATEFAAAGKVVAAICAAPTVLADLGLLKGLQATCYPGFEKDMAGAETTGAEFVRQGNLLTGRALGAAIPFGLELLAMLEGEEKAAGIRAAICYEH